MVDNSLNMSIPIKFEIKTAPRGMSDYDPKALNAEQQKELNMYKIKIRRENLLYFLDHPEVRGIIALVVRMTLSHQPRNIIEFIAKLFTLPERVLRKEINKILKETPIEYNPITYCEYDEWDF